MDRIKNIPLTGIKPVEPSSMIRDKLPNQKTYINKNSGKKEEKIDFRSILEKELESKSNPSKDIKRNFDELSRFIKSQ
jgi:hypothetical protein